MLIDVPRSVAKLWAVVFMASPLATAAVPVHGGIKVTQGTNMEVAVSPDRKLILADLQGILYSIPYAGGVGHAITTPLQEASHPDWSAKGGFVAMQCYAGGTFHIWMMHPDGSGLKQVTFGHGDDREPRVSPDGKTIAFDSDRAFEGSYDIWTVDVASGALLRVTSDPADEYEPNWSPDGKGLVFVSGTGIAAKSIEYVDLASKTQHTLLAVDPAMTRVDSPSFSPDGKHLAYVLFKGEGMFQDEAHLVVTGADGGEPSYTGNAGDTFPFPANWLSDGELVYTANGKILRVDLAGGTETPIAFRATIPSSRPQYVHKHYDFDSSAARTVKGIYGPALARWQECGLCRAEPGVRDEVRRQAGCNHERRILQAGTSLVARRKDAGLRNRPGWRGERLAA